MIDSQIENKGVFVGAHNMRGATIHEGKIINFGQAEKGSGAKNITLVQ